MTRERRSGAGTPPRHSAVRCAVHGAGVWRRRGAKICGCAVSDRQGRTGPTDLHSMATLPRYTGTQYRCIDLGRDLCAAGQPIAYRRLDPGRLVTTSRRVGRVTGLRAQELLLQGQQAAPTRVPCGVEGGLVADMRVWIAQHLPSPRQVRREGGASYGRRCRAVCLVKSGRGTLAATASSGGRRRLPGLVRLRSWSR